MIYINLLFLRVKFEEMNELIKISKLINHHKIQLLILYPYMNVPQTVHYLEA